MNYAKKSNLLNPLFYIVVKNIQLIKKKIFEKKIEKIDQIKKSVLIIPLNISIINIIFTK